MELCNSSNHAEQVAHDSPRGCPACRYAEEADRLRKLLTDAERECAEVEHDLTLTADKLEETQDKLAAALQEIKEAAEQAEDRDEDKAFKELREEGE